MTRVKNNINQYVKMIFGAMAAITGLLLFPSDAHAVSLGLDAMNASTIFESIINSISDVPALLTALGYLLGIMLGVWGVFKLKDHVENPSQNPIRTAYVRLLAGGALLALPTIYRAMQTTLNGGEQTEFNPENGFSFANMMSGVAGSVGGLFGLGSPDLNGIMASIIDGLSFMPLLISGVSYLLGLMLGIAAILKFKDHVENPDQTPLREGVVRFLIGGALFALPSVFSAMSALINGGEGTGIWGAIQSAMTGMNWLASPMGGGTTITNVCDPTSQTVGGAMCGTIIKILAAPAFLNALAYLFGLVLGVWGILKIRDHALNPSQTSIWEGVSRLVAGGAFFSLPVAVEAVKGTVTPDSISIGQTIGGVGAIISGGEGNGVITGYAETDEACGGGFLDNLGGMIGGSVGNFIGGLNGDEGAAGERGVDMMMYCMMSDIIGPVHSLMNVFSYIAGLILIMIGISRLTKSAQEGARGPGGMGTFMTFIAGGALISYNEFIRAFSFTMFGDLKTKTYATLSYTAGMDASQQLHATTVISAILKFMIIVGLISFIRGIFIVRNVAEGNGQASMMAGVTHLVGGALAINLGAVINLVQSTLGITGYGITFN